MSQASSGGGRGGCCSSGAADGVVRCLFAKCGSGQGAVAGAHRVVGATTTRKSGWCVAQRCRPSPLHQVRVDDDGSIVWALLYKYGYVGNYL